MVNGDCHLLTGSSHSIKGSWSWYAVAVSCSDVSAMELGSLEQIHWQIILEVLSNGIRWRSIGITMARTRMMYYNLGTFSWDLSQVPFRAWQFYLLHWGLCSFCIGFFLLGLFLGVLVLLPWVRNLDIFWDGSSGRFCS